MWYFKIENENLLRFDGTLEWTVVRPATTDELTIIQNLKEKRIELFKLLNSIPVKFPGWHGPDVDYKPGINAIEIIGESPVKEPKEVKFYIKIFI